MQVTKELIHELIYEYELSEREVQEVIDTMKEGFSREDLERAIESYIAEEYDDEDDGYDDDFYDDEDEDEDED